MNLRTFSTAAEFLAAVRPSLARHEAEHHLVLGVAEALATSGTPNGDVFAASVADGVGLVAAVIMSGQRPLLIASDRPSIADAVPLVWDALTDAGCTPSHAIGAVGQVEAFAQ